MEATTAQQSRRGSATAEIDLDICTPEGKTWLAQIVGLDPKYGFAREFLRATYRHTSRSGRTGTATYVVGPGVYESHEPRRGGTRRYWQVRQDGTVEELDLHEVRQLL